MLLRVQENIMNVIQNVGTMSVQIVSALGMDYIDVM